MRRAVAPPACRTRPARQRGFTLVELIVVLSLIGLMASLAATAVTRLVAAQQDNRERLRAATVADAALQRLADELRFALPNSLRVSSGAGGVWVEWVPVVAAGRYREAPSTVGVDPGDPLDLSDPSDASFDVIGPALSTPPAGTQLALHNLGTTDADAYAGTSRRAGVGLAAGGTRVTFTPAGALPQAAGTQRFFLVGTPVSMGCVPTAGGRYEWRRYSGYGWQATQPAAASDAALAGATVGLMLSDLATCEAAYSTALANIGLLTLRVGAGDAARAAQMALLQQIAVDNTP